MKKYSYLAIIGMTALILTGCQSEIPEMSEKETEMVTEYAAGTVLEHVPSSGSRLVDTSVEYDPDKMTKYEKAQMGFKTEEPEPVAAQPETEEEIPTDGEAPKSEDKGQESTQAQEQEVQEPSLSAADVLEMPGLALSVASFSVTDSYPEAGEGADMFLSMDASAGNKLVVAHLNVKNEGSEPLVISTVRRSDLHYKVVMNNENKQNTLLTLLLDDFSGLKDQEVAPGETFPAVLVAQVSDELAAGISDVSIEITSDVGKTVVGK